MDKNLYLFYVDCGRMGTLQGLFVATQEEVDNLIGEEVCFYEVLGKHSEIGGHIEADEISLISDDQEFVKKFDEAIPGYCRGVDPRDYLRSLEG